MGTTVYTPPDWKRVKEMQLVDIMINDVGLPHSKSAAWVMFKCPVHGDHKTASLAVNTKNNTWYCFGSCKTGGDAFDWFKHRYGMSQGETYEHLTGEQICRDETTVDLSRLPEIKEVGDWEPTGDDTTTEKKTWEIEEVSQRTRKHVTLAETYFMSRGITRETVNHPNFLLGEETWNWTPRVGDLWSWSGDAVKRHHYTIPNIWNGKVLSVKCRRDDRLARQMLVDGRIPDDLFGQVLEVLHDTMGAENVTEADILDAIFGPRFKHWTGGDGNAPFNQRLVCDVTPEGLIVPKVRPVILITEAEIDAMYFRDVFGKVGYPAIALHKSMKLDLKTMLSGVTRIVIVEDNDPNGAGHDLATGLLKEIGRGEITTPPYGKDANDVKPSDVKSWMDRLLVRPLPRALI